MANQNYLGEIKPLPLFLISFLFGFFLVIWMNLATLEGDSDSILAWAQGFRQLDLKAIPSTTLSPQNIPLVQQSHGAGLMLSLFQRIIPFSGIAEKAFYLSFLTLLLFSGFSLFKKVEVPSSPIFSLCFFGLIGTPLFYYLFALEHTLVITALLMSLLNLGYELKKEFKSLTLLGFLFCFTLLTLTRFQFIVFAPALFFYLLSKPTIRRRFWIPLYILCLLLIFIQTFQINFLHTENLFQSAYSYTLLTRMSMDWFRPEIFAFLFHPINGLLLHHPLWIISCYFLFRFTKESKESLPFKISLIFGLLLFTYAFTSWWAYFSGLHADFGARGMATLVPLFFLASLFYLKGKILMPLAWIATLYSSLLLVPELLALSRDQFINSFSYSAFWQNFLSLQSLLITLLFAGIIAYLNRSLRSLPSPPGERNLNFSCIVFIGFLFAGSTLTFIATDKKGFAPHQIPPSFKYQAPFEVQEVKETLDEFSQIYHKQKQTYPFVSNMLDYLDRFKRLPKEK